MLALILAGSGLALTLWSTLPASAPPITGAATRPVLNVPAWAGGLLLATLTLALLQWLALKLRRPRRRRRADDDFELEEPPRPFTFGALLALLLPALALIALLSLIVLHPAWLGLTPPPSRAVPVTEPSTATAPPPASAFFAPAPARPLLAGRLDLVLTVVLAGLSTLLLAALAFGLYRRYGRRANTFFESPPRKPATPVLRIVEEGLDALDHEADPRRVIIRCFQQFEQLLENAGWPREPWMTATEWVGNAGPRVSLPDAAVTDLVWLFEQARFGSHSLPAPSRTKARQALARIRIALAAARAGHAC